MKLKSILNRSGPASRVPGRRARALRIVPVGLLLLGPTTGWAADQPAGDKDQLPEIKVQHGRFEPSELTVPANVAFKVLVTNGDSEAIEWESFELHRERVVGAGETITVYIPSLSPGTYKFFDDFHRDTPEGTIIVK